METSLGAGVPDFGLMVLKGGGALLLVLALLFLSLYVLRRLSFLRAGGGRMRMLEVLQVGPRERVVLVAVGGRELLIGVTAASISTLAEISGEKEESSPVQASGFRTFLAGVLQGEEKKMETPEAGHGA